MIWFVPPKPHLLSGVLYVGQIVVFSFWYRSTGLWIAVVAEVDVKAG